MIENRYTLLGLMGSLLFLTVLACSPQQADHAQDRIDETPTWVTSPPLDNDEYIYGTASATSSRQNIARQRAEVNAKQVISGKLGEKVEALQKLFEEEVSDGDQEIYSAAFTNATQVVTDQELVGTQIDELRFMTNEQGNYIAHILMRMPVPDATEHLDDALSREEEMYIRFKESEAFKELHENLERLEAEEE